MKSARKLVVDSARRHLLQRHDRRLSRGLCISMPPPLVAASISRSIAAGVRKLRLRPETLHSARRTAAATESIIFSSSGAPGLSAAPGEALVVLDHRQDTASRLFHLFAPLRETPRAMVSSTR